MKFFAILSALLAVGLAEEAKVIASPYYHPYAYGGYGYAGAYAAHPYAHIPNTGSQFHAQDEFGNLNYGYSNLNSVKQEVGNTYGGVTGGYSYVDANGVLQTVRYIADGAGFRVEDSRLPVAPTADLALPVAPVFDGVAPTFNPEPLVAPVFTGVAPEPVQDTPEVVAAREAHLAAHAALERKRRDAAVIDGHTAVLNDDHIFIHNPPHRPVVGVPVPVAAPLLHHAVAAPVVAAHAAPLHHGGFAYGYGLGHGLGYAGLGLHHGIVKRDAEPFYHAATGLGYAGHLGYGLGYGHGVGYLGHHGLDAVTVGDGSALAHHVLAPGIAHGLSSDAAAVAAGVAYGVPAAGLIDGAEVVLGSHETVPVHTYAPRVVASSVVAAPVAAPVAVAHHAPLLSGYHGLGLLGHPLLAAPAPAAE